MQSDLAAIRNHICASKYVLNSRGMEEPPAGDCLHSPSFRCRDHGSKLVHNTMERVGDEINEDFRELDRRLLERLGVEILESLINMS